MYRASYSPGRGISKKNKSKESLCQDRDVSGAPEAWESTIQYTEATKKSMEMKR